MSNAHPFWTLPLAGGAKLLLTPCPGTKGANLQDSLMQLKDAGATAVLTALEMGDLPDEGLNQLAEQCKALELKWFHLPIEDDCAPGDEFNASWPQANKAAQVMLDNGEVLVVHCMGGSGRTGLIAARIMLDRGIGLDSAIEQIQALRPGAFTRQAHIDYIKQYK
ncbi:phosphatase domain-containing putative toxin [Photobacterium chitinilyticum]|uniref:Phosphatase n=1 Tax=Photobacterium chitinilyticum TaxID=2485123 RepID=A0A444JWV1_9GAMM|nr:dual specificity protein phosphatase family protein [Photobacterium chitinilyticum]RWX57563.1 phosphatase [Photobacterium chitinilyticum]